MPIPLVAWGGYFLVAAVVAGVGGIIYSEVTSSNKVGAGKGLSSMYMDPNWSLLWNDTFVAERGWTCGSAHTLYVWTHADKDGKGKEVIVGFEPQERGDRGEQYWDAGTWWWPDGDGVRAEWEYSNQIRHQVGITLRRKNSDGVWETINDNVTKGGNPDDKGAMAFHFPLLLPGEYEIKLQPVSSGECYKPVYNKTVSFSFQETVWQHDLDERLAQRIDEALDVSQSQYEQEKTTQETYDNIFTVGGVAMLAAGLALIVLS